MVKHEVVVRNKLGLHMRAAARVTQLAACFNATVTLTANGKSADATRLIPVMILAASKGTPVSIESTGPEEVEAVKAISRLIDGQLGEPSQARE